MTQSGKVVRVIPADVTKQAARTPYEQIPVAAYCRVSTKQEEQLNSYEVQKQHYEELILSEAEWRLAGIFADRGISGTSLKKRDEFNRMLRLCQKGRIKMIITKSISRFARNTLDCISVTRKLREIGVDVYFEEQNLHSIDASSEFYISIYGSVAQSESENISANVKWGKAQSAKNGNVSFNYKHFLGYRRGEDGAPEIVPEEAETVRTIYGHFLAGDSLHDIAVHLEAQSVPSPGGKQTWRETTIRSILSNEKYKGDAVLGKTYVENCLTKRIKANRGERQKFYVENNHPAIIDAGTFARVQEELARRGSKQKVKQVGTKTEQGRYSGKYALTELLVCGECGTPYRRCTWTARGERKIVWRCISRLDYGKKYCHHSPSLEEGAVQRAIMEAISTATRQNADVLQTLKLHVGMGLCGEACEDRTMDVQIRIAQIDAEFSAMLDAVSAETDGEIDEARVAALMEEKQRLTEQLAQQADARQAQAGLRSRLDEVYDALDALQNHPLAYDDYLVRQTLSRVIAVSKHLIRVVFPGGLEVEQEVE